MKQRLWYTLYKLSELGATQMVVRTSTTDLAKTLEASQQTASRHLMELEKGGYILENASFKGIEVKVTERGIEELRKIYLRLKTIIEGSPNSITIEGTIFSGLGEGAYYISQREYKRQFERKVGFIPYPGTLNLKLSSSEIVKKKELEVYPLILVRGFEGRKRLFGDVRCYPSTINNEIEGAVIVIDRTHYDASVMEVIAPVNLKSRLHLKDGDRIILKFFPRALSGRNITEAITG